jgi:hypothetical protein
MSQVVNIPLSFEFRPLKAKWSVRTAEIEGWAKDVRRRSLFGYIGSSDDVTVDLREPETLGGFAGLTEMVHIPLGASNPKHPAVVRWTDIPADIKAVAASAENMGEIRGSSFHILACESSEGVYGRTGDAWAMRREFLRLKRDSWELLQFLRKWGVWDERKLGSSNLAPGANAFIQNVVFPEVIWELQSVYREALTSPPDEWLSKGVDPFKGAYATPMYPHFILEHTQCKLAIEATISIDLIKRVKFRKCRRPDCSEVFALESKHKRIYCGQPCAHLESVRKQRRAAARLQKKSPRKKEA